MAKFTEQTKEQGIRELQCELFTVSSNLELTQHLLGVLINMAEDGDSSTQTGAMVFASHQDAITALLHIALDYVFGAKVALEKLQD